jgi:thiol-disulfide isomerase/thioredoxin
VNRRQAAIAAGVGAAAGVAGIAAGLGWSLRRSDAPKADSSPGPGGLWTLRWPSATGGEVQMARLRGKPLVLNFWATWCEPCLREMPALDRFARDFSASGWQVVGIAVDQLDKVKGFLTRTPVSFTIAVADSSALALARSLGNEAGALPFSVVVSAAGALTYRKLGESSYDDLAAAAKAAT